LAKVTWAWEAPTSSVRVWETTAWVLVPLCSSRDPEAVSISSAHRWVWVQVNSECSPLPTSWVSRPIGLASSLLVHSFLLTDSLDSDSLLSDSLDLGNLRLVLQDSASNPSEPQVSDNRILSNHSLHQSDNLSQTSMDLARQSRQDSQPKTVSALLLQQSTAKPVSAVSHQHQVPWVNRQFQTCGKLQASNPLTHSMVSVNRINSHQTHTCQV
jgi:hypothetical protein